MVGVYRGFGYGIGLFARESVGLAQFMIRERCQDQRPAYRVGHRPCTILSEAVYSTRMPALIAHYGVVVVVLIIFAGEVGIPTLVPGEIAILIVASQVVHSVPELVGVWLLFGIVDIVACTTIHCASRTGGNRVLVRLLRYLQSNEERHEETIDGWRRRLGGRDALVVFVTRLIPVFRLYASVTTGLIRIRLRDFLAGAAPASFLWASIPLSLGYLLRTQLSAMENRYPQMIHYVILGSVAIVVVMALVWWVRAAGTRAGGLRRIRTFFGLCAVGGVLSRLVLTALYGDRPLSQWSLEPSLSALSVWVMCLSMVALGLLWIAARDLSVIRRYRHPNPSLGFFSTSLWMGLMLMFCGLNAVTVLQHPAVLG